MKLFFGIFKTLFLVLLFFSLNVSATELKVGSKAPVVSGINQDGKPVDLASFYKANKFVLVYFYPKANTPGCTDQAMSLKDSYQKLHNTEGVGILGVSADPADIQKDFQKKYSLPFDLISDTDKKFMTAFGVPTNLGMAKRQAFLIKEGKVVWLDKDASTKEQADDIIKYILSERE